MSKTIVIALLASSLLILSLEATNTTITGCTGPGCLARGCPAGGCPNPSAQKGGNKMAFGSCSCGAMRMQDHFGKGGFGGCMAPHKSFVRRDATTEAPKTESTTHPKGTFQSIFGKL
ncbi:unnamed protein product [Bursaphelenchus okinawaensis]|uniref:Uncharacterized protein n=1 Tax=Bursaphelenchus okinawaensis TaxID=465554 RepID=A0A811K4D9_9BILA|nr:unnamed protein product [Bursaphelenchus okinawaensis]CAG9090495.1 unnamed protein product [Bursaphelenchus okinawaensis]